MSGIPHIPFDSYLDIEAMIQGLSEQDLRTHVFGRSTNLDTCPIRPRMAYFDANRETVVGRVLLHRAKVTSGDRIIMILERESDHKFYLLRAKGNSTNFLAWTGSGWTADVQVWGEVFGEPEKSAPKKNTAKWNTVQKHIKTYHPECYKRDSWAKHYHGPEAQSFDNLLSDELATNTAATDEVTKSAEPEKGFQVKNIADEEDIIEATDTIIRRSGRNASKQPQGKPKQAVSGNGSNTKKANSSIPPSIPKNTTKVSKNNKTKNETKKKTETEKKTESKTINNRSGLRSGKDSVPPPPPLSTVKPPPSAPDIGTILNAAAKKRKRDPEPELTDLEAKRLCHNLMTHFQPLRPRPPRHLTGISITHWHPPIFRDEGFGARNPHHLKQWDYGMGGCPDITHCINQTSMKTTYRYDTPTVTVIHEPDKIKKKIIQPSGDGFAKSGASYWRLSEKTVAGLRDEVTRHQNERAAVDAKDRKKMEETEMGQALAIANGEAARRAYLRAERDADMEEGHEP